MKRHSICTAHCDSRSSSSLFSGGGKPFLSPEYWSPGAAAPRRHVAAVYHRDCRRARATQLHGDVHRSWGWSSRWSGGCTAAGPPAAGQHGPKDRRVHPAPPRGVARRPVKPGPSPFLLYPVSVPLPILPSLVVLAGACPPVFACANMGVDRCGCTAMRTSSCLTPRIVVRIPPCRTGRPLELPQPDRRPRQPRHIRRQRLNPRHEPHAGG